MTIKECLERKLKKRGRFTTYSPTNIPLDITTEDFILCDTRTTLSFDMDCEDLEEYCQQLGLRAESAK
jgi:hypothetical protein